MTSALLRSRNPILQGEKAGIGRVIGLGWHLPLWAAQEAAGPYLSRDLSLCHSDGSCQLGAGRGLLSLRKRRIICLSTEGLAQRKRP